MTKRFQFLVTCEHGGKRVPAPYDFCFQNDRDVLKTHRAFDLGALQLAKELADCLDAVLIEATVTRLLVDLNRSLSNRRVFSSYARTLDAIDHKAILDAYYHPYRRRVEQAILQSSRSAERTIHMSVHSFTPKLNGMARNADIGLLYDPKQEGERQFCLAFQSELAMRRPDLNVRRNYPYRGTDDGLTRYLRRRFAPDQYVGIELEVNQKWPSGGGVAWRRLRSDVISGIMSAVV